jgi:hypothetical protein
MRCGTAGITWRASAQPWGVNFGSRETDVEAVPDIVARIGREVEAELRPKNSQPE